MFVCHKKNCLRWPKLLRNYPDVSLKISCCVARTNVETLRTVVRSQALGNLPERNSCTIPSTSPSESQVIKI